MPSVATRFSVRPACGVSGWAISQTCRNCGLPVGVGLRRRGLVEEGAPGFELVGDEEQVVAAGRSRESLDEVSGHHSGACRLVVQGKADRLGDSRECPLVGPKSLGSGPDAEDADGCHRHRAAGAVSGAGGGAAHPLEEWEAVGDEFPEDGVLAVEVEGRGEGDEELAATGVGAAVGHGEQSGAVVGEGGVDFVPEAVAGAVGALAIGGATLHHEAADDAVEGQPIEKRHAGAHHGGGALEVEPVHRSLGQGDEVGHGQRGLLKKQPGAEGAGLASGPDGHVDGGVKAVLRRREGRNRRPCAKDDQQQREGHLGGVAGPERGTLQQGRGGFRSVHRSSIAGWGFSRRLRGLAYSADSGSGGVFWRGRQGRQCRWAACGAAALGGVGAVDR